MSNKVKIQVADTPASQELGYQFIRSIPDGTGMLFKFQSPRILSFWMKNTYVPLDIAFMGDDGIIVKTESMVPLSLRSVTSGRVCTMALEVPAGTLNEMGWSAGKQLFIDLEAGIITDDSPDETGTE